MKNIEKLILLSFIATILALPCHLFAQENLEQPNTGSSKTIQAADKIYKDLGYKSSLKKYKIAVNGSQQISSMTMIRMANSYRLNGDYENAEKWYAQVVEQEADPIHKLHYAQAMHANGNFEKARKYYLAYDRLVNRGEGEVDKRGRVLAEVCKKANEFKEVEGVEIRNVMELNTDRLDFSPTYYEDGLVFISTRKYNEVTNAKDQWIDDNFMDTYFAKKNSQGLFDLPTPFSSRINTKLHEGPLTFNKTEDVLFFTRNNFNKGKRKHDNKGVTLLKIYTANKEGNSWNNIEELSFNDDDKLICHPTLSPDGNTLYFAMEDINGMGGMDLYQSQYKEGNWGEPQNLGPKINTAGNEVFPFMHDDGTLYFASNGLEGMGGLDIFSTNLVAIKDTTFFTNLQNLGVPFNSTKDDFGFIKDLSGTEGYFTSNRPGGLGGDDLYSWFAPQGLYKVKEENEVDEPVVWTICVYDEDSKDRISNAQVTITETSVDGDRKIATNKKDLIIGLKPVEGTEDEFTLTIKGSEPYERGGAFTSGKKGEFEYEMTSNTSYTFTVNKLGYEPVEKELTTESILNMDSEFCIPMLKKECTSLTGIVLNKKYKSSIPNATVEIIDRCTGEQFTVLTNEEGQFDYCLDCNCEYDIVATKHLFSKDQKQVTTIQMDCSKDQTTTLELTYDPEWEEAKEKAQNLEGMVIVLEKLFYDFDEYYIRPDASAELDKLVEILNEYPSMEIELSSHTDARGSTRYNERLSQNRAEAAIDYLISKGILASRLTAKGYGEKRPRNGCRDNVDCDETQHQYNRRTEIKISKFSQFNEVNVEYRDTAPKVIDKMELKKRLNDE